MNQIEILKKLTKKKIILTVVAIILLPFLVYAGSIGLRLYNLYTTIHQGIDDEVFEPIEPKDLVEDDHDHDGEEVPLDEVEAFKYYDEKIYNSQRTPKDPNKLNILLIGVDARTLGGAGRADSIMIVQYNRRTNKSGILSIPRDTFVRIPGRGFDKINHAFAFGRTRLLKETVELYLDIHIDHFVQLDMQSFVRVVDRLGGININVPQDMVATDGRILFTRGDHKMNGATALSYTAARKLKSGGGGDFGRIQRQQQIVTTVLSDVRGNFSMRQTLSLLEDISSYIRTDITPTVVMRNWSAFNSLNINEIQLETLRGTGFMHNRVFYLRIPIQEAREKMAKLTQ